MVSTFVSSSQLPVKNDREWGEARDSGMHLALLPPTFRAEPVPPLPPPHCFKAGAGLQPLHSIAAACNTEREGPAPLALPPPSSLFSQPAGSMGPGASSAGPTPPPSALSPPPAGLGGHWPCRGVGGRPTALGCPLCCLPGVRRQRPRAGLAPPYPCPRHFRADPSTQWAGRERAQCLAPLSLSSPTLLIWA